MNWLHPEWLALTWLVLPLGAIVFVATWLHRRRIDAAFGTELALQVLPASTRRRRTLRDVLLLAGTALFCIALAEPAFDKEIRNVETEGVDLVLALDLSRSMDADDVDPSRLERARREIKDLLDVLVGDRVAVVFFAGEAIGRLPLTEDYKAIDWVLGEADTRMFRAQGSAVDKAIDAARELLARDEGKAGKAMVIFSDGETHQPEEALRAAREAAAEDLVIYTVAIGDAPSTIPLPEGGVLMHEGAEVKSVPDFATLTEVARITGGATVKSVPSASDMEQLYRTEIRSKVRAAKRDTVQTENWRTAFQTPLGLGLGCWLLGLWLGDGRRPFGAAAAALVMLSLAPTPVQAAEPDLVEADALYRSGDFRNAERALEELSLQSPDDADLLERLGAARYRLGDFLGSATAYERASELRGGDPDDLFNAGNARYRAGQLESAIERYDGALAMDPEHRSTQNRSLVEGELAARRQEQPPPPPQPSQGGEDEQEGGAGEQEPQDPTEGDQSGDDQQDGQGEGDQSDQDQPSDDGSADAGDQPQQEPTDQQGDSQGGQQDDPSEQDQPSDDSSADAGDQPQQEPPDQQGAPSVQDPNDSEGVDPDELDGDDGQQGDEQEQESEGSASDSGSMGEAQGDITPAQASRMLDAVEEGRQRVQFVGREGDKPW